MRKTFCDSCQSEIGSIGNARLEGRAKLINLGPVHVEVTVLRLSKPSLSDVVKNPEQKEVKAGQPDLCSYCILSAVDQLDDRPRAASEATA